MLFSIVKTILIALGCTAAGAGSIRILQAERYQIPALKKQLSKMGGWFMGLDVIVALATAGLDWYLPMLLSMAIAQEDYRKNLCGWIVLGLFALASFLLFMQKKNMHLKREFGLSRRICRLIAVVFALNLGIVLILNLIKLPPYFLFAAVDYVVLLAAYIMRPVEDKINSRFYNSARQKLAAAKGLVRIGITGSFGKTQAKQILKSILSEKYRVLATPPSFSTAMGISRTLNEQLKANHQVFIAEMGAQYKGDIKDLVKLVRPQYGMITCVGNAHLDTFGSAENAAQTKFELIQGLPENGKAFFGADNSYGDRLYGMCKHEKFRAGIGDDSNYMRAENIETGIHGTRFRLICADGSSAWMKTKLLGAYSVQNIALCAALAKQMGWSMEEIARGVEKIQPLKHRLQLVAGDVNIIDNSANTMPEAAAEALQVLAEFPGRRILVTGGFTELEEQADVKNHAYGIQIVGCADYVVLIDPENTRQIAAALAKKNYLKSAVRTVYTEADAAAIVKEIATKGDTILYEGIYPQADDEDEEE